MKKPKEIERNWIFITPIDNLVLTNEIGREIRIEDVTFIHRDKLPYVRKRLGFNKAISEIKSMGPGNLLSEFFTSTDSFAVLRRRGKVSEIEVKCYKVVKEAIDKYPNKLIGFFTMNPRVPEMTDLMYRYKDQGFRGVVTDPRFGQGHESKRFHELVECALVLEIPVWLHSDDKDTMRVYIEDVGGNASTRQLTVRVSK